MLLHNSGKSGAAEAILRRLLNDHPADARILSQVGSIRMSMGDLEAARHFYDRALAANPQYVDAVLGRGIVAQTEGHPEQARTLFLQARALSPGPLDPVAQEAGRRLRELSEY
jgi:Flp pilus assembly protein TadD